MQTIRITITTDLPTVMIAEQKVKDQEAARKAAMAALDDMFRPVLKAARKV